MRVKKHATISRNWTGPGHTAYSTEIDGVVIYRTSLAALARVYMECCAQEKEEKAA